MKGYQALYGAVTLIMLKTEMKGLNMKEMRCLRSMGSVDRIDPVRFEEMRRKTGVTRETVIGAEYVEIVWPCGENLNGSNRRGFWLQMRLKERLYRRWMDNVKGAMNETAFSLQQCRIHLCDRKNWIKIGCLNVHAV